MEDFRILEGREYAYPWKRHWLYRDPEILQVRVVHIYETDAEVKILSRIRPHGIYDDVPLHGEHLLIRLDELACELENVEQYLQEQREVENNRVQRSYLWAASKWKRRKPRTMSKPGARNWEPHSKESRTDANRRDRHQTKNDLRIDNPD